MKGTPHSSNSKIGASPSGSLMSYPGHLLGVGSYPSAEVQLVYSTALADWARLWLQVTILNTNNLHGYI